MIEFKLPELGENVTAGDVLRVLVKPGDGVTKEQPVVELETDKATIEVPSSVAGTVKEIKVKAGDKVQVGAVILTVDDNGAGAAATKQEAKAKQEEKPPEKVVSMPRREAPAPQPVAPPETPRAAAVAPKPPEPAAKADQPQVRAGQGPAAPASPSVRRVAREIG